MSDKKAEVGKAAGVTAVVGLLMVFISIFRSEYLQFLDKITWKTYYLTQILFMVLLVGIVAYLVGKLVSGTISVREIVEVGRQLKELPNYDERTRKRRAGEIVFLIQPVEDLQIDIGRELNPQFSSLDFTKIKKESVRANLVQILISVALILILISLVVLAIAAPEQFDNLINTILQEGN